jgi:Fic family protein
MAIRYETPRSYLIYDPQAIAPLLAEAKAAVLALRTMPYQREWVEALQRVELKMEVAGTSRIEGAEFTERELQAVLDETTAQIHTRSQRQALAAKRTYEWLATIPDDRPVTPELICEIHARMVTGADDDHCPPGVPRAADQNVTFGTPRHRGIDGGEACARGLAALAQAIQREFRDHDRVVQALGAHYHFAAMHPFLDGNGRTARALEALLLQRAGLRDTCFIAMSNYYYEEKHGYLDGLAAARAGGHDLTPFLRFALAGVAQQVQRVLGQIQHHMRKALFRDVMRDLFGRLKSPRKRVLAERQMAILTLLLDADRPVPLNEFFRQIAPLYARLKAFEKAMVRDLAGLSVLGAIAAEPGLDGQERVSARLEWPTEITETKFFDWVKALPKAKTRAFPG